jgi:hypothetical protein
LLENPTKIQHFVSRTEQRLNGIPPDRNRIYKFEVVNRNNSIIKFVHKRGVGIRANLAIEHLFSFDKSGSLAKNFENLFQRYEQRMSNAVNKLEEGLAKKSNNLSTVLYEIWLLKFLNIWRNPYGVKKFLNTFYMLTSYRPTDQYFLRCYQDIDDLKANDLFKGFSDLELSLKEYKTWLKVLLLLLMPNTKTSAAQGKPFDNIFEQIAYDLLTNTTTSRFIKLHVLSEGFPGRFLLNDRSYFYSTEPRDKDQLILNFNITDRIAMTYMIITPDRAFQNVVRNDPGLPRFINQFGRELGEELIRTSQTEIAQDIQLMPIRDNLQEVEQFNKGMILQAKRYVFCSQKDVIGATIKY